MYFLANDPRVPEAPAVGGPLFGAGPVGRDVLSATMRRAAVALAFDRRDRLGDVRRLQLVAELTGKGANLVLIEGADPFSGRILERLREDTSTETHLVISSAGKRTLAAETSWSVKEVEALADRVYDDRDVGASLASGSFRTAGMIVSAKRGSRDSLLASQMATLGWFQLSRSQSEYWRTISSPSQWRA